MKTLNSPKQRILKNYFKKCTSFYKERQIIQNLVKNMQLGCKIRMLFKVEKNGSKSHLWCEQETHEYPITNFDMF
jgi:hypothetical protein